MTSNNDPRAIDLAVEVAGTPEQVWQAIATGAGISAWLQPTTVQERVGGAFAFDMTALGLGLNDSGRVTVWEPPHRFATGGVRWQAQGAPAALLATEWAGRDGLGRHVSGAHGDERIRQRRSVGPRDPGADRGHAHGPGAAPIVLGQQIAAGRAPQRLKPWRPARLGVGASVNQARARAWTAADPDHAGLLHPHQPSDELREIDPMRKLYSLTFMSLDGVIEAPDRWHFAYYSDQMGQELRAQLASAGAMLLGRVTYQEFAAYWPQQPPDAPFADLNNTIRKYVVSTTLDKANWNNTTLINRNIP
jgi:uncharacterized protein YndB with AHSA1/START domain